MIIPFLSPTEAYFYRPSVTTSVASFGATAITFTLIRVVYLLLHFGVLSALAGWRFLWPLLIPLLGLMTRGHFPALLTQFHYEMRFAPVLLLVIAAAGTVHASAQYAVLSAVIALVTIGLLTPIQTPTRVPNLRRSAGSATARRDRRVAFGIWSAGLGGDAE